MTAEYTHVQRGTREWVRMWGLLAQRLRALYGSGWEEVRDACQYMGESAVRPGHHCFRVKELAGVSRRYFDIESTGHQEGGT